ncbi:unnamed protein product, partial [Clonostachys rhizophaga]
MDDPLRPSDEIFKQIYEQGFTTWHTLYQKAIPLSQHAPLLRLENVIPQHPKFPSYIEIGDDASIFLNTNYTFRVSTNRPTTIALSSDPSIGFTKWFGKQDNHLLPLTLAWAYVFSARWASVMPNASIQYTKKLASWRGDGNPEHDEPIIIDIGGVTGDALRWWAAILAPGEGWNAYVPPHERHLKSPWSTTLQSTRHLILCSRYTHNSLLPGFPPTWYDAVRFISDYVAHHHVSQQSHAAFMAALLLPTSQTMIKQVVLHTPRLSGAVRQSSFTPQTESQPWGSDEGQLDRLLTLGCNSQGIISLLGSAFIEPSIPCNACGAWIQGALAVLENQDTKDPHVLLHILINRSPQLGFLWLGALLAGIQASIMKRARAAFLGIDLQVAVWTNTLISFIQLPTTPTTAKEISRSDEARLMFLTQAEFHKSPPIVPFEPFGRTDIADCILEVQVHSQCKSSHGLYITNWAWAHDDGLSYVGKAIPTPKQVSFDAFENSVAIDFGSLDRERDCSETATRSMFLWLRGEDGYPVAERDIYLHEWINGWDSDEEDQTPEGDGKSTRQQRVGPWLTR